MSLCWDVSHSPQSVHSLCLPPLSLYLSLSLSLSHGCHHSHLPFTRPSSEMQMSPTILTGGSGSFCLFFFLPFPENSPLLLFQLRSKTLTPSQGLSDPLPRSEKSGVSRRGAPPPLTGAPTFASLPHIAKEGKEEKNRITIQTVKKKNKIEPRNKAACFLHGAYQRRRV